jgi:uncharacterized protein with GYD domain
MPIYMHQFKYKDEGIRRLLQGEEPLDREAFLRAAAETFGGKLLSFYFCFGEFDGVAISRFPDETHAFACVTAVFGQGRVQSIQTTQLVEPADGIAGFRLVQDTLK